MLKIADDADKGYLLMVSLHYPASLHAEHNCFPLAPIKRGIRDDELSAYAKSSLKKLRGSSKRPKNEKLLYTQVRVVVFTVEGSSPLCFLFLPCGWLQVFVYSET